MVKSLSPMVHRRADALLYNGMRIPLLPRDPSDHAATGVGRMAGNAEPSDGSGREVCYFRLRRVSRSVTFQTQSLQ